MPRVTKITVREGTTAEWAAADAASGADPSRLLDAGEPGRDTTLNLLKFGDGVSTWAALPPAQSGTYPETANNLSDLADAAVAVANIGAAPSLNGWNFVKDPSNPIEADGSDETAKLNYWAAKGGRVLLPSGRIKATDSILIQSSGTVFTTAGRGATFIDFAASDKSVFKGAEDNVRYYHCGFEDIHVDVLSGFSNVNAFDFTRLGYSWLRSCAAALRGPGSTGIYVQHAEDGSGPYYCTIDDFVYAGIQATNRGIGFGFPSGGPTPSRSANAWNIRGGRIAGAGIGIDLQGNGHFVSGVTIETTSDTCIKVGAATPVNSAAGNFIVGCYAENASGTPKYVEFGATATGNLLVVGLASGMAATPVVDNNGGNSVLNGGTVITNKMQRRLAIRGAFAELQLQDTDATGEVNTVIGAIGKKVQFRVGATARWQFGIGATAGTAAGECTVNGEGIILKSPDGTRYKLTIANGGTVAVAAV